MPSPHHREMLFGEGEPRAIRWRITMTVTNVRELTVRAAPNYAAALTIALGGQSKGSDLRLGSDGLYIRPRSTSRR